MKKEPFDERQLQIRKNIFKHGFFVAIGALLLNAFLNDIGIVWANALHQNILILTMIITVVSMEFHAHNVYFERDIPRVPMLSVISGCALILAVFPCIHFAQGATFFANRSLTDEGAMVIYCVMFLINASYGIIQFLRSNRDEKINEEVFTNDN
ncbi:MAG: hypothetical protein FWB84_06400 [Candidatus Bathyarchaeota archaeon]|uniref:hypothetical protein n=1 Tax=Candidatus Bathycorpusculum sp. TaxID=2994959 RepID=UPI002825F4B9|nr:hypothetical protein [Candidatus Termiticorpusculum sp.]MCL2291731.1 hypothetical protein [Candidatus Termiticorpusculum sp.]